MREVRRLDLSQDQLSQIEAVETAYDQMIGPLRRDLIRQIQKEEEVPPPYVSNIVKTDRGGLGGVHCGAERRLGR